MLVNFGLLGSSLPGRGEQLVKGGQSLPIASASISDIKSVDIAPIFYSNVELRHQLNAYIEKSSARHSRQDPSVQFRAQLGSVLYQGIIDLYLNLSAEKLPKNLAVYQRRPELNANVYMLRSKHFKIRQYNIWRLPFSPNDEEAEEYETKWDEELDREGTVYIVGLNPSAMFNFDSSFAHWDAHAAIDLNSRLYSRTQYTAYIDRRNGELRIIEDHVPRLGSIQSLGGSVSPKALNGLKIAGSIYYRSFFLPVYFKTNDLGVQNRYTADRASYYRLRFQFQLNKRTTLINDFMHFHQGFFAAKRVGREKRYKNILRLSCVL
ncbi:MAG: hypothetical protein AB8G05_04540 [Oligoflexales bacterium]